MNLLINKKTLAELMAYKAKINRSMTTILEAILFEWAKHNRALVVDLLKLEKKDPVSVHVNFNPTQKAAINTMKKNAGLKSYEMVDMAWKWWKKWWKEKQK